MLNLGYEFPDLHLRTTVGSLSLHEWMGSSWAMLMSHPSDFTPVCTSELARVMELKEEFDRRGVKVIAISCNDLESHKAWIRDICSYCQREDAEFPYPIIADEGRDIAAELGMLDFELADPLTCRAVFIIGPDKKLKLALLYPATSGRNFDEILRVIDSLQLYEQKLVATPVNWQPGDECVIMPNIKEEDQSRLFPRGIRIHPLPSGKSYLRFTPQP